MKKCNVRSVFRAASQKFKILAIPNVLSHGRSYKHGFVKKCDGHKLCTKSIFDRFFCAPSRKIPTIPNVLAHARKFKILTIPNVLAHEKSYERGFVKKLDGHNLCAMSHAKSSFDRFFVHHLSNSKDYLSKRISPWEVVLA
ncbi:hypothetical protein B296_00024000 [Ensete ventricosum]|uniref:Uncharacterized protein n=1 Tax=Ensete ventricosum TaxID=4639 RepID=A0A427AVJ7_ENSVE|nr:hypothetical protein B296_00024000 [Ensete ventricosum]